MAVGARTEWTIESGGNSANGGGFNPGNANMATDGAATSANTSAPVFTSASYTFVAGDVGHWVYIQSGTNWTPGWYPIASVNAGAATLSAAVGDAVLNYRDGLNTAVGCATVASPTGAVWSVDYSMGTTVRYAYTDLVIDGTTNTDFTSAGNPIGKNCVGNIINVTGGTGFTVQRVEVSSVTGTTGRADKSMGTLSSIGGTGNLGAALSALADVKNGASGAIAVAGNTVWMKGGTYTRTAIDAPASALFPGAVATPIRVCGWTGKAYHRDIAEADMAVYQTPADGTMNSTDMISLNALTYTWFRNIKLHHRATGTRGDGWTNVTSASSNLIWRNCVTDGCIIGWDNNASANLSWGGVVYQHCTARNGTTGFVTGLTTASDQYFHCVAHDNSGVGFSSGNMDSGVVAWRFCVAAGNGSHGFLNGSSSASNAAWVMENCIAYQNGGSGFHSSITSGTFNALIRMYNNILWDNGAYSINITTASKIVSLSNHRLIGPNFHGSATTAEYNNMPVHPDDVTMTTDPFVDGANLDFTLDTGTDGDQVRNAGWPGRIGVLSPSEGDFLAFPNAGAIQDDAVASAGGMLVHPGMSGGMNA